MVLYQQIKLIVLQYNCSHCRFIYRFDTVYDNVDTTILLYGNKLLKQRALSSPPVSRKTCALKRLDDLINCMFYK